MNFEEKSNLLSRAKDINGKSKNYIIVILLILPILAFAISIMTGRYSISFEQFIEIIVSKVTGATIGLSSSNIETVLFTIRLPRIFAAMLVGAGLSMSGAAYQGMFKNPMVSPDILGASAGAGFGAAFGILMEFNNFLIQITAFIFGIFAVCVSYFVSKMISRSSSVLTLVLTGMVVSTLFQSFISLTKYVGDPYTKLPAITFWLMGGLSSISVSDVKTIFIPITIGVILLILLRWRINALSFGEEEAKAMGIDTAKLRFLVIISSTLITSASVSISGMIGWVGLIIPHLTRMIVGPNFKALLPASFLIGTTYLLIVDDMARSLFSVEIPLGILTSLIGAPFFIYLLLNGKKGWV